MATRLSEATIRQSIDACPSGVVITDGTGKIVLVNAESERLFGYSRDELVDRSVDMLVPESAVAGHAASRHAYQFFEATSFITSISRSRPATNFFSRAFSASSCRSRRTSFASKAPEPLAPGVDRPPAHRVPLRHYRHLLGDPPAG